MVSANQVLAHPWLECRLEHYKLYVVNYMGILRKTSFMLNQHFPQCIISSMSYNRTVASTSEVYNL